MESYHCSLIVVSVKIAYRTDLFIYIFYAL